MPLSPDVTMTETEHGMVLLDQRTGRYWTLNPTGAAVVRLMLDGATAEDAATALRERHPGSADRVAADVDAFVRSLREARVMTS
ncbi:MULTISPECIES: lasso peptide biosynthesis PqqD family chaperone [Actinomadura]|uniref:Lasso peptide biosynthesis PqqD family chaperone n=1 Tax=Actinomadura yumaensis TaxID=111807 RepID=A0ABW2CZ42_9ACTN|nr:lasso peptide biosynthesis PqqD family chaperone [Actinomadura sp. J1-007]MWK38901.1 lasso peptide biosynthesis PqqD family chaperone [Actinomadura sp. J1-007]